MADDLTEDGILTTHPDITLLDYVDYHDEPVHVDDSRVVFADTAGHELDEWADALEMDRGDLSARMHDLAREVYGRDEADGVGDPWAHADPVVFDADTFRRDGGDAIAMLLRRGCGPAAAIDWHHTVERSWSQSAWADWRGVEQQAVSENVARAREQIEE